MKRIRISFYLILLLGICLDGVGQLTTSNLPIFIIDTKGQTVYNDPKVNVNCKVIFNGEGKVNSVNDRVFHYDGNVGIEYRGSSSQQYPKKSYSIELRKTNGDNNPQAFCGMPIESDFVLFASYAEKSLMHYNLALEMGRKLFPYASRSRYVEIIVNGSYEGVYVLMEKIKIDKNRINISTLLPTDNTGDELTGGYIVKVDKSTGSNPAGSVLSEYVNKNNKRY
ncbi:MAG: CotH kinase family protein, partial [Leadbetterella sp.]